MNLSHPHDLGFFFFFLTSQMSILLSKLEPKSYELEPSTPFFFVPPPDDIFKGLFC